MAVLVCPNVHWKDLWVLGFGMVVPVVVVLGMEARLFVIVARRDVDVPEEGKGEGERMEEWLLLVWGRGEVESLGLDNTRLSLGDGVLGVVCVGEGIQ